MSRTENLVACLTVLDPVGRPHRRQVADLTHAARLAREHSTGHHAYVLDQRGHLVGHARDGRWTEVVTR
jgi:hypothetical protein